MSRRRVRTSNPVNTISNWSSSISNAQTAKETKRIRQLLEAQALRDETPEARQARVTREVEAAHKQQSTTCTGCSTCVAPAGVSIRRLGLLLLACFTGFLSLLMLPFEKRCPKCGHHTLWNQHAAAETYWTA